MRITHYEIFKCRHGHDLEERKKPFGIYPGEKFCPICFETYPWDTTVIEEGEESDPVPLHEESVEVRCIDCGRTYMVAAYIAKYRKKGRCRDCSDYRKVLRRQNRLAKAVKHEE